jgi:hypothetical protein
VGAQGWSIGIGAEGWAVLSITTAGTAVDRLLDGGFNFAELVNPDRVPPGRERPQGQGAVSAVVLAFQRLVTLPPEGTERIAVLRVAGNIPASGESPAALRYVDGFVGHGQPVGNAVTFEQNTILPLLGSCATRLLPLAGFLRGDCNGDGKVTGQVTDAVYLLNFNFLGGRAPPCLSACDANGDGRVLGQVTDAVYLLNFNFLGGRAPPAPFPGCGPGTAADEALGCAAPPACAG